MKTEMNDGSEYKCTPTMKGAFDMWFYEFQPGDGTRYKLLVGWNVGRFGFPGAGDEYHLIVYNNGWYFFHQDEFDGNAHAGKVEYFASKLKCSLHSAEVIIKMISSLKKQQAKWLLKEKGQLIP